MLRYVLTISRSTVASKLLVSRPCTFYKRQYSGHCRTIVADLSVDGFSRTVYLINGQQPGPLIDVDEGDDLEVFVKNDLPIESTIH